MALSTRHRVDDFRLVHHSDRGCQYVSGDYTQTLTDNDVLASVGSTGDAYDNAIAESFVDGFKAELIADRVWRARSQLELAIAEYISWFNDRRLHETSATGHHARSRHRAACSTGSPPTHPPRSWRTFTAPATPRSAKHGLRSVSGKRSGRWRTTAPALYFENTREQAGEAAVQRWAQLTENRDPRQVALIADASNVEIDRLNARAQHLRAERGDLGDQELQLPNRHYGLREGDLVTFTAQHRPPGAAKVENGARGEVTHIHEQRLTVTLDGSDRQVRLAGEELENLRLAYAQHAYGQQGATVDRSIVVTGGWQTSRESAYVQASRARHGTEWYLSREELGLEGQDERRSNQLAEKMRASRRQTPSLAHRELPDREYDLGLERALTRAETRLPRLNQSIDHNPGRDRAPGRTL